MRFRRIGLFAFLVVAAACGSRTGLFGNDEDGTSDGGSSLDGSSRLDGSSTDSGPRRDGEVDLDALPPIDATPLVDVNRNDCPDADSTLVYVVTTQNELYAFYPPDLSFRFIGNLVCPAPPGETPFSMAVDRRGVAYVLYTDGSLYRVSTLTAACVATTYRTGNNGFRTFGMGFAADPTSPTNERLYVADNPTGVGLPGQTSRGLGVIDTTSFALGFVGPFSPTLPRAEFTGTADGRLFAYWPQGTASAPLGSIAQVDPANAQVRARIDVPVGTGNDAFAFAFYGGDFWMFNSQNGGSTDVSRFRLADNTTTMPTTFAGTIVGAGVSTCAPNQ